VPELTITPDSTVVATSQQLSRDVGGEVVILGLNEGIYYGLNPVGARVWNLIQDPRRVGDICDAIMREYDVSQERCESDVLDVLQQLAGQQLIEVRA
jgi:hypothetical protein